MNATSFQQIGQRTFLGLCIIFYVCAVGAYAGWSNQQARDALLDGIDKNLLIAAKSLKYMLAPDFHDRAIDKDSISKNEEMKNRTAVSAYAFETEFEYLYTVAEKDGKFYFSAPTVTEAEAKELESWYFYPYEDIPAEFIRAFREKKTEFVTYSDQWGFFRSVALPQVSPGGRTYLACADYKIDDIDRILRHNLIRSILTALFFLLISAPFIVLIKKLSRSHLTELQALNQELTRHKEHLEEDVNARTQALHQANQLLQKEIAERRSTQEALQVKNDRLEAALKKVKTLSGLLPICASCKKVRDDRGYWRQLETYVSSHSEAEFSHGLCPACAKKLYPDLDFRL